MIERILAHYGYVRKDSRVWDEETRHMKESNKVARAHRWITFYNEDGGLKDMIASLRHSYFEKVGSLKPDDTAGLQALGMADRIAREIDAQAKAIIDAGKVEASQAEHAAKIAALPEAQRRRL